MTELHRLDQWLVALQLVPSRQRAEVLIKEGGVEVNGVVVRRPGKKYDENAKISLLKEPMHWVSRGALKLISALDQFNVDPKDRNCLDVGASTGGFTQVLLDRGASKIVALDVGTGQLAPELLSNKRVFNLEKTNIREATLDLSDENIDLVVIDVSFISLRLVLPELERVLKVRPEVVALVKPQFEVGKEQVGKKGIVRDVSARENALKNVRELSEKLGYKVYGHIASPITGGDGNHEYLIHLK